MRFNFAEAGTDPSFYLPLARRARRPGYDGFIVPDSIAYPAVSDTKYPFNPDGSREFLEDKPFLDPFALIAALGAVTERLRFVTFVIKLPIRHPVLVAKQAASVAVLTGDRLASRGRVESVARGLRAGRRAVGGPRTADGRMHRGDPRPHRRQGGSSTMVRCSTFPG